jgi:hypothetical protein
VVGAISPSIAALIPGVMQAMFTTKIKMTEFNVAAEDVHDNSMVDLDDIFSWMDVDLSGEREGKPW